MKAPLYKIGDVIMVVKTQPATKADGFFGAKPEGKRTYAGAILNLYHSSQRENGGDPGTWVYELQLGNNGFGHYPKTLVYEGEENVIITLLDK
jgi:hypothetical protein